MTDSQLDFAALDPVNHLWPAFVERLGSDKAQRAVRQALDLQGMRGHQGTLPVLFTETGGLALASTDLVREQTGLNATASGWSCCSAPVNRLSSCCRRSEACSTLWLRPSPPVDPADGWWRRG